MTEIITKRTESDRDRFLQMLGAFPERFREKVKINPETECWEWQAVRTRKGYGQFKVNGVMRYAHRVAYELRHGAVPAGLELDHLCRVRHCVNPKHLEPVTHRENVLRGEGPTAENATKTHCPVGHVLRGENLRTEGNGRRCRTCQRAYDAARYLARKSARDTGVAK